MDKKVLAGIGIIAVGGIAVIMMSRSSADPSMPGAGAGGGGVPPPETKKESDPQIPVFNITFPEPNFPSIPNPMDYYNQYSTNGGYSPPRPPTKKEQITAETGFTSRTGGGEGNIWIGGR